jgi:poly(3-hydroxybutyrate) depolymerase
MLDQILIPQYCVDSRRIYATGFSNGGYFSHRLACELSDRIAAISAVGGVNGMPTCNPTRPISVLQTHGTTDGVIDYALAPPTVGRAVQQESGTAPGGFRDRPAYGAPHADGPGSPGLCEWRARGAQGKGHRSHR